MDTPQSMHEELGAWNNGTGVDLETWISCVGNYKLAVGYLALFWPEFTEHEGYIFHKGFSENALRSFEASKDTTRQSIEWVMNHIHIADIHCGDHEGATQDKIILLGRTLKEMYALKLASQFPYSPCTVDFYEPEDKDDLQNYQLSFWQKKHEQDHS